MDYKKMLAGTGAFLIGYMFAIVTQYVIPTLIDQIDSSTIRGLIWLGTMFSWTLTLIVIPLGLYVWGLTNKEQSNNPIFSIAIAVIWCLFSIALTWATAYWLTPLTGAILYPYITVNFWLGLITVWIFNIVAIPAYTIIEAKRT